MRLHQLSLLLLLSAFALGQFPNTSAYGLFCLVKVRNRNIAHPIDEQYRSQYFQSHPVWQDNVWLQ